MCDVILLDCHVATLLAMTEIPLLSAMASTVMTEMPLLPAMASAVFARSAATWQSSEMI
ncbi:MAG: hypothetical protein LBF85_01725 [Tannerella sp.]|nr:hypothetical protein [Tannerella sp.]